jgi:hypothetical protein
MENATSAMLITGAALILIELARSVPAWLRVRRTGSSDGVSPTSVAVLAGTSIGWIAVAVLADSVAAAVATTVWLCFHLLLWREIARVTPSVALVIARWAAASFIATLIVAIIGMVTGHLAEALGLAIAAASAAYSIPALFAGITSKTTSGLSMVSLLVNSVEGAIYLTGGLGLGGISPAGHFVLGYIFFGATALLSNGPRLMRTVYRRMLGKDKAALARETEKQSQSA